MHHTSIGNQPGIGIAGNAVAHLLIYFAECQVRGIARDSLNSVEESYEYSLTNLVVPLLCRGQLNQFSFQQFLLARMLGQELELLKGYQARSNGAHDTHNLTPRRAPAAPP